MLKMNHSGYLRILYISFPYIIIVGIFQSIAYLMAGLDYNEPEMVKTSLQQIIITLSSLLGTLSVVWIFVKYVDKVKFKSIGFQFKNALKESLAGFTIGALSIIIGFLILVLSKHIIPSSFTFDWKELLFIVLIFIVVAVTEEVLLRGYVLRNLMIAFNKYVALIISASIFSLLHAGNPNYTLIPMLSLFLSGLLYGITYMYNQRLWYPIAVHFSWNLFQTLLGFNVSGLHHFAFMNNETVGEKYITGGDFGFEGSMYSVIIQTLFVLAIFIYFEKKKLKKA